MRDHGEPEFSEQDEYLETEFVEKWIKSYPKLLRRARRLSAHSRNDPEDLLSQATVKVLHYSRSNNHIDNVEALMHLSLKQAHLDNHRNLRERVFNESSEFRDFDRNHEQWTTDNSPETILLNREAIAGVVAVVTALPAIYQRLFTLRFVKEKSYADIADDTGLTVANTRQRIRRLRLKLGVLKSNE